MPRLTFTFPARFAFTLMVTTFILMLAQFSVVSFANAANMTLKVKNDKRRIIDFGVFSYGGANDGVMELKVLDFLIHDLDEYETTDEKIGFALDLVPNAAYARKERKAAVKRTKVGDKEPIPPEEGAAKKNSAVGEGGDDINNGGADDGNADSAESYHENICFVDDPAFTPETRYLLPLQDSLARIGKKVDAELAASPTPSTKVQRAAALRVLAKSLSATIAIRPDKPGFYALFFYNCKKANRNKTPVPVTFRVKISQFNIIGSEESGNQYRSFLGFGDTKLPELYLFTFVIFCALTTVWHIVLYGGMNSFPSLSGSSASSSASATTVGKHRNVKGASASASSSTKGSKSGASAAAAPPPHVLHPPKLIHKLMYLLLVLKCLSLFFEAVMLNRRRSSGKMSAYVDYIFYGFQAVKGFFLFTVILLLGSGWSLLKPFLSDRDRKLLILLLPLQLIINIAIAVISSSSEGSKYWSWWRDTLRLVDIGCCIAVLLPVITSIHSLGGGAAGDRAAQQRLGRLRQFRTFYLVLVGYMFITRVVLDYVASAAPYNLTWVPAVIGEMGALFLYVVAGYMFRPAAQAEWEQADKDSVAELEAAEEIELANDEEDEEQRAATKKKPLLKKSAGKSSAPQSHGVVIHDAAPAIVEAPPQQQDEGNENANLLGAKSKTSRKVTRTSAKR